GVTPTEAATTEVTTAEPAAKAALTEQVLLAAEATCKRPLEAAGQATAAQRQLQLAEARDLAPADVDLLLQLRPADLAVESRAEHLRHRLRRGAAELAGEIGDREVLLVLNVEIDEERGRAVGARSVADERVGTDERVLEDLAVALRAGRVDRVRRE